MSNPRKVQRVLVELSRPYDYEDYNSSEYPQDKRPLIGNELDEWVMNEVGDGNFVVRHSSVEDYKGPDDENYRPLALIVQK